MANRITIEVKEGAGELRLRWRKASAAIRPRIRMLLLIQSGVTASKDLAAKTGMSTDSVAEWKKRYQSEGLAALLREGRGGSRNCPLTEAQMNQLGAKLSAPKGGFTSYVEALQWINQTFGAEMHYQAANKFLKRNFHTRLKVGRKVHVQKDPQSEAAFKKEAAYTVAANR